MSKRKSSKSSKSSKPNNSARSTQPTKAAAPPPPATKNRGWLLTTALVIVILHGIILTAAYYSMIGEAERTVGNWALIAMALTSLADVVAAVAMWFWKRWGILLYGVAAVVQAVVVVLGTFNFFLLFGALLPAIVVLYIVNTRRSHFV